MTKQLLEKAILSLERIMLETLWGELIHIWYYFDIQLRQIFMYWVLGMVIVIGSLVSVSAKDKIHELFISMQGPESGQLGFFWPVR